MIIPPFAGVVLVEYEDRISLTPIYWYREFVGLGRFQADRVGPQPGDDMHPMFHAIMGDKEIWVIASWRRYEDGREEAMLLQYLDPEATRASARKAFRRMVGFLNMSEKELRGLAWLTKNYEEDLAYIANRFPDVKHVDPKSTEDWELYQARLKVLAGMQPKTVELLKQAGAAKDPQQREKLKREVVSAYFAEVAQSWTAEQLLEWQRGNPVGAEWMCEFARVLNEPERELDPVNHELVLNWLHRGYNLMTEKELSDAILKATGQYVKPNTLKKKRSKQLGLTARPPGPRPKSEQ
jgi:hypothetical protein